MKTYTLILILLIASMTRSAATEADSLHLARLRTDRTGMHILGGFAAANILYGTVAYFGSQPSEARSFHGMNAVWNLVNLGIAGANLVRLKHEFSKHYAFGEELRQYELDRRIYLFNLGLDFAYIGGGLLINSYADRFGDRAAALGIGKSIAIQGVALMIFDISMSLAHSSKSKAWYGIANRICLADNGIGLGLRL